MKNFQVKNHKKGFIATSLVYSFFLVFISILAVLISTFIANKTILDRFNVEVMNKLDSDTYKVIITSINANVQNGITLTNLISNGSFTNNCEFWQANSHSYECNQIYSGYSSLNKANAVNFNQNVYLNANNRYYYSIKYLNNTNSFTKTYINNISNGYIESGNTFDTWKRSSQIFSTNTTGIKTFYLGIGTNNDYTRFTDVLLIDLTSSFSSGREPDKTWLDENIDYFNGTISLYKKEQIDYNDEVKIYFNPYVGYDNYTLNCTSSNNTFTKNISTETNFGGIYKVLKLGSIKSDIKCVVEWRK